MALGNHLRPDEDVLARIGPYYATSRRVLRYEQAPGGKEEAQELLYARVGSIELVRPTNHPMMVGGTILALSGLFVTVTLGFFTTILVVPFGLAFIFLGARGQGKEPYYQLHINNATRREKALWRIPHRGSMDFMGAVGYRTGWKPIEGD